MSPKQDATRDGRAKRAELVREATGLANKDFAAQAAAIARELGLGTNYEPSLISKLIAARQDLSLDDAIVFARLDPQSRGVDWLALGEYVASPRALRVAEQLQSMGAGTLPPPRDTAPPAKKKAAGERGKRER